MTERSRKWVCASRQTSSEGVAGRARAARMWFVAYKWRRVAWSFDKFSGGLGCRSGGSHMA
jgi:hypothetical protein